MHLDVSWTHPDVKPPSGAGQDAGRNRPRAALGHGLLGRGAARRPFAGSAPTSPGGRPRIGASLALVQTLTYCSIVTQVNIQKAKTHLSRLLLRVAAGEEIVMARAGKPVALLVPANRPRQRLLGRDEGQFEVPDDFDAPLPADTLAELEG